jgi:protein-tyrosine phosphatase
MNGPTAPPGTQIPIETLPNLRDLGGYRTADGQMVGRGRLYRSVLLGRLSDPDLKKLGELGLRTVFDFRTAAECEATPDRDLGARQINLDVVADRSSEGPASLLARLDDPEAIRHSLAGGKGAEVMQTAYRELIELPSASRAYGEFFTRIAADDSLPALFHCMTGKDRTGWAAAATLLFLGVSEEDVFHDYLQTNLQLLPALQPLLEQFRSVGGNPEDLKPVLGVDRAYLSTAIELMEEKYGSINDYMREGLGLGDEVLDALRARLLVG